MVWVLFIHTGVLFVYYPFLPFLEHEYPRGGGERKFLDGCEWSKTTNDEIDEGDAVAGLIYCLMCSRYWINVNASLDLVLAAELMRLTITGMARSVGPIV